MREIKFRVWCKQTEEMHAVERLGFDNGELWYIEDEDRETEPPYFPDRNDSVLMQYTGLKDKNGKEIYEGDILTKVKNSSLDLYVSWCQDECYYDLRSLSGVPFKKLTKNNVIKSEVIGNIYENAELLEEAK